LAHDPQTAPTGASQPTRRAETAATRRKAVARRRIAVAVVVVAVVLVGGSLLFRGGDGGIIGDLISHGPEPEYAFAHVRVTPASTTDTKAGELKDEVAQPAEDVRSVLDHYYTAAFVDDGQWGDYGEAWDLFDDAAGEKAQGEVDVLTLGSSANDVYDSITPDEGSLEITVLTNRQDRPHAAVAKVTFSALLEHQDGTYTTVTSTGSFFLRRIDGEWRIFAYEANRKEEAAEAPASASPSEASPS
jgi:hypothetical protein